MVYYFISLWLHWIARFKARFNRYRWSQKGEVLINSISNLQKFLWNQYRLVMKTKPIRKGTKLQKLSWVKLAVTYPSVVRGSIDIDYKKTSRTSLVRIIEVTELSHNSMWLGGIEISNSYLSKDNLIRYMCLFLYLFLKPYMDCTFQKFSAPRPLRSSGPLLLTILRSRLLCKGNRTSSIPFSTHSNSLVLVSSKHALPCGGEKSAVVQAPSDKQAHLWFNWPIRYTLFLLLLPEH